MSTEGFIREQEINGIKITIADVTADPDKDWYEPGEKYWKAGKCDMHNGPTIRIWPLAHTMYGWDVMRSVLIHEFGHLRLFVAENIYKGLEAENKANRFGCCYMRHDLVPQYYWLHRELFLPSHLDNWDETKCRSEYAKWITWMRDAPMVRALSAPPTG